MTRREHESVWIIVVFSFALYHCCLAPALGNNPGFANYSAPVQVHETRTDNYRIARPSSADVEIRYAAPSARLNLSSGLQSDAGLLGQYIFKNMRTPQSRSNFSRWMQNYIDPIVCNMVLCNGSCGDFEEHCPSLSESRRSLHLRELGCGAPGVESTISSPSSCCSNNKSEPISR